MDGYWAGKIQELLVKIYEVRPPSSATLQYPGVAQHLKLLYLAGPV